MCSNTIYRNVQLDCHICEAVDSIEHVCCHIMYTTITHADTHLHAHTYTWTQLKINII